MELAAARATFTGLGAAPDVARTESLLGATGRRRLPGGLTAELGLSSRAAATAFAYQHGLV